MIGRTLVTGGGGQLASDLEGQLPGTTETTRVLSRDELDVTDGAAVDRVFADFRPQVVFNCAAFHNLDVCEQEEARSFEVNATAVKRLAQRVAAAEAKLVHVSTNYVFDGLAEQPYTEAERPNPGSIYAISKLSGEYAALSYAPGALVVRSAGLYGLHGSASKGGNFVQRMLSRAREQGKLKMVADQRLQPTFTADLAAALIEAVTRNADGVLHLTNSGACSWLEFTHAIMETAGLPVEIEPVQTTREIGQVARPLNGVLAADRVESLGMQPLRAWRPALDDYMSRAGLAGQTS